MITQKKISSSSSLKTKVNSYRINGETSAWNYSDGIYSPSSKFVFNENSVYLFKFAGSSVPTRLHLEGDLDINAACRIGNKVAYFLVTPKGIATNKIYCDVDCPFELYTLSSLGIKANQIVIHGAPGTLCSINKVPIRIGRSGQFTSNSFIKISDVRIENDIGAALLIDIYTG